MVEKTASCIDGELKARAPPAKRQRLKPLWRRWIYRVATAACAGVAAAGVAAAAAATARWRLPRPESTTVANVAPFPSFADVSFSAAGITSALGHDGHVRPSCEPSDDPEYVCLLSRPPGAFNDEFMVYLSAGHGQLSVKVVVAGLLRDDGGGKQGGGGWVSVGVSPDGRMAGPSEAVVGFVSGAADGTQGPAVLRYRMDGYSPSAVVHLPEEGRRRPVLSGKAVETTADGTLILRFKRPFSLPATGNGQDSFCASEKPEGPLPLPSPREDVTLDPPLAVVQGARHLQTPPQPPSPREEGNERVFRSDACGDDDEGLPWLDPREEGVVLLWAYASGGSPWPSYHDRTGAFPLPRLPGDGFGGA